MLNTTHDLFSANLPETAEISPASDFCTPGAGRISFTVNHEYPDFSVGLVDDPAEHGKPSSINTVLRHRRLENPADTQYLAMALLAAKEEHQRFLDASYPK